MRYRKKRKEKGKKGRIFTRTVALKVETKTGLYLEGLMTSYKTRSLL